jgi:trk system potassium uptake protein
MLDPKQGRIIFRSPRTRALRLPLNLVPKPTNPFSSSLVLMYSFAALIILGAVFLMFPFSSIGGHFTSPMNAFFTSTSAVTLTGLNVVETGQYWSTSGQIIIFLLFQFGGLGFIVGAALLLLAINGRFGLRDRLLIGESLGVDQVGGVVGFMIRVGIFAIVMQCLGAFLLYLHWLSSSEEGLNLWTAFFHSASAFYNSGFDIFGRANSLGIFQKDAVTLLGTAVLIILGSTGYVVVADMFRRKRFRRFTLDTKIVIVTSAGLLVLGTLIYFLAEYSDPVSLGPLPLPQKLAVAFFQAVSPRTAGFSVWNFNLIHPITLLFTVFLMFVGGAVGSTAGGVKVNTFGILLMTVWNVLNGREHISAFGRQVTKQIVFRAMTLVLFYLVMAAFIIILLSITDNQPLDKIMFETFSALSTVGLSTGITPLLSPVSQSIIMVAMFFGRLAPLALIAYIVHHKQKVELEYPHENIRLG